MAFDKLLKEVGEFGFFQKVFICGYLHAAVLLMTAGFWSQVFILLVPPHRCKTNHVDNIYAITSPKIQNTTINTTTVSSTQCYLDVFKEDGSEANSSDKPTCPYDWVYDYSHLYPSFSSEHDWVCDNSWRIYTIHSIYWIGSMTGFAVFGSLSDRFGRKLSYMSCVCLMTLGDIGSFFANDFITFAIGRFISAAGEANLGTYSFVFAIEYTGPRCRVTLLAVWALSYTFGSAILSVIVSGLADWHYILAFSWGVGAFSFIVTIFVPESASWLITRGRWKEAAKCIHRVAKINGKQISLEYIEGLLKKDVTSNEQEKSDPKLNQLSFLQTTLSLFPTPNLRKNTILSVTTWMLSMMCYAGISLETTNLPLFFPLPYVMRALAELPSNIICLFTLNRIGRRWANVLFFSVGGVFGIIAGGFIKNPVAVTILVTVMRMCNGANFQITFTMSSELFPTVVRGRGASITRIFGAVACSASPFIFSLSEKEKFLPVLVFRVLCIIGGILTLFLPETTGENLSHTMEEGENFLKTQSFFYIPCIHSKQPLSTKTTDLELTSSSVGVIEDSVKKLTGIENTSF